MPSSINVGLMGHVDSGKTTLAKALSSRASTAAFDKHPQSKERGITLDLGFSLASLPSCSSNAQGSSFSLQEVTLVDCPGHASLLRTIVGGIHLIDALILVIDASKGLELQTRECLLLAEIFQRPFIVALNKMDLIASKEEKSKVINRMTRLFSPKSPVIPLSALGKGDDDDVEEFKLHLATFLGQIHRPRNAARICEEEAPVLFMVDHVFSSKGHGTVITGTMLSGTLKLGDSICLAASLPEKKIRSIHAFGVQKEAISAGDRAGISVGSLEKDALPSERILVTAKSSSSSSSGSLNAVCRNVEWLYCCENIQIIPHFRQPIHSRSVFNIFVGHEVCECTVFFIGQDSQLMMNDDDDDARESQLKAIFISLHAPIDIPNPKYWPSIVLACKQQLQPQQQFLSSLNGGEKEQKFPCRFAFHAIVSECGHSHEKDSFISSLSLRKSVQKWGQVDKILNETCVLVGKLKCPLGAQVEFENGTLGIVESFFGQKGKMKVSLSSSNGIQKDFRVVFHSFKAVERLVR